MKRFLSLVLVLSLCFGFIPYSVYGDTVSDIDPKSPLKKAEREKYVEGEAIILLEDNVDAGESAASASEKSTKSVGESKGFSLPDGVEVEDTLSFSDVTDTKTRVAANEESTDVGPVVMNVSSDDYSTEELVEVLEDAPGVKYAEPNYKCYSSEVNSGNDYFDYQWGLNNTGQNSGTTGSDIKLENIWDTDVTDKGKNKSDTIVAVLDSGVDYTHQDLKDRMWTNKHTGRLAGKHGYDFYNYDTEPMDDYGHGTHVAGILGGAGTDTSGISGVDQGVQIMALKFLDYDGFGDLYDALSAYEYIDKAISLGYKVKAVNNSWGAMAEEAKILESIVNNVGAKGCISVCAAGNDGMNIDGLGVYPAAIDSTYVISVAASNEKGELADFSNYGVKDVDLAAPGSSILSSVPYETYNPTIYDDPDSLSNIFLDFENDEDFENVKWQNWVDGKWDKSDDSAPSPTSEISRNNSNNFGISNSSALEWKINDVDEDAIYNMYIPYDTTDSAVSVQMASAIKMLSGVQNTVNLDYWGGEIIVSETNLDSEGNLPNQYSSIFSMLDTNLITGTGTDTDMNCWDNINGTVNSSSKAGKKRALVFTFFGINEGSDVEILFDDLGISKGGDSNANLGQYAFYSGTSMAAPMVTGSLALLSEAKPSYSAEQLAMEIKTMSDDSLTGNVASGGVLDMSGYADAKPHIFNAKVSGNYVVINGAEFGDEKGTIAVNGQNVDPSKVTWKNKSITIPAANVKNKMVTFKVTTNAANGSKVATAEIYVVSGKPSYANEGMMDSVYSGSLTTDGTDLYYAGYGGTLSMQIEITEYDDDDYGMWGMSRDGEKLSAKSGTSTYKTWSPLAEIDPKKMFPDATASELQYGLVTFDTEVSYLNGKFYTIVSLDSGYSSCYAFAAYDINKDTWTRLSDRPGAENTKDVSKINKDFENVKMSSLAAYNGKIYLMGGMNVSTNKASNKVQVYNPSTKKWSAGPAMPDSRFLGVARQTGDKLVLSMGGNGLDDSSATCPLIFNGKTWSKGRAVSSPMKNSEYYVSVDNEEDATETIVDPWTGTKYLYKVIRYYNAAVGIVEGGIAYCGLASDSLGDTYTYNVSSNSYSPLSYQYSEKATDEQMIGCAVGGKFYVTSIVSMPEYDEEDEESWVNSNSGYESYEDMLTETYYSYLYSVPVKSGLMAVTGKHKGGKLTGKGNYLPGQTVKLKAKAKKKYYFKKRMTINGVKTKKSTYTIPTITKKTHVVAKFAKYKTKVKLNKKKVTAKVGDTIKLKAKVKKAAFGKKKVKWKVSNKKYAKVSKKGKVTIKKKGKGKTVKVYAIARDGSKAKAVCKIKIE